MTSIITHEIEERYPYPDNGERPVTQTRLGACLASRKAYGAGATRNPTDREIDMAALAIKLGTIQSDETGDTLYSAHPSLTQDMYRGTITLALLRWIGHLEQFSQITNQQDKDDA